MELDIERFSTEAVVREETPMDEEGVDDTQAPGDPLSPPPANDDYVNLVDPDLH